MSGVNSVNWDHQYLNLVIGHLELQLPCHNRMQHEWYTGLNSGTVVPYSAHISPESVCTDCNWCGVAEALQTGVGILVNIRAWRLPAVSFPILYSLKPSSCFVHHQVEHSVMLRSVHTVYLCVLCGSQNKQRLFPYTALTDWFL